MTDGFPRVFDSYKTSFTRSIHFPAPIGDPRANNAMIQAGGSDNENAGGGPSGLLLSQLLHLKGIDTVLLEKHSREYVLSRIRAGVLEHGFAELMREAKCGERMDREGEIHNGFFIAHDSRLDRIDLHKYSGGSSVIVYGQTELTRDLYEARAQMKGNVIHNTEDVGPHDIASDAPYVTYRDGDKIIRIDCDYIICADGFHGVSRKSIPKDCCATTSASIRSAASAFCHARSRYRRSCSTPSTSLASRCVRYALKCSAAIISRCRSRTRSRIGRTRRSGRS
jgi:hypothetical protein